MLDKKSIVLVVQLLLIAGALNWGLVAYNGTDLVKQVSGGGDMDKYAKFVVAAAGLYAAYMLYEVYTA
jgi:uncharacterized membrane protein YuzA (DUF378 family)